MKRVVTNLSLFAVLVGLTFASACSNKVRVPTTGAGNVEGGEVSGGDVERAPVPEDFASNYGVMNFRQLAATFESLTGVTLNNGAVLNEYEAQIASLPKSYDPASMSAAKVSAATKLAASYCDAMSQDDALLTARVGSNMATLGSSTPGELADTMLTAFYGPATALQGDRAADIATVTSLITDLRAVQVNNQAAPASSVFMGACAAILSSAEFYLY